ncbi:MAG: response regulator transcription factor [Tissierellales bacterium]|nr:response regulator transcription factor [Tissierellales bacterium]
MNNSDLTLLIAEDEEDIRGLVSLHLQREGYKILQAADGQEALELFNENTVDLLILDIMMPKLNGFEVLSEIRKTSEIPVIFLTARSEEQDKIRGLGLGADDYVSKPFSVMEMVSRVQAQLRRYINYSNKEIKKLLTNGDLTLNLTDYSVLKGSETLDLNPKEFKLLKMFMENIGVVYTKKQLYEAVWNDLYWGDDNTIMVHISHLREKIETMPKSPQYIKTIRGIGYRMEKVNA